MGCFGLFGPHWVVWVVLGAAGLFGLFFFFGVAIALWRTPLASVASVSLDNAPVFAFVNLELVLEELKCHFNVLLYSHNLAKLVQEYRPKQPPELPVGQSGYGFVKGFVYHESVFHVLKN